MASEFMEHKSTEHAKFGFADWQCSLLRHMIISHNFNQWLVLTEGIFRVLNREREIERDRWMD